MSTKYPRVPARAVEAGRLYAETQDIRKVAATMKITIISARRYLRQARAGQP